MRKRAVEWACVLVVAVWTVAVVADVWDPADNTFSTANELVHGSEQVHQLGQSGSSLRDMDFYRVGQRPHSSYEVVVDGTTNEIAGGSNRTFMMRYAGTVAVQGSQPVHAGVGHSESLRWENAGSASLGDASISVTSTAPCFACSSNVASYHIRAYETTYSIPRFNNSSTQVTVLLIQNTAAYTVSGNAHFFSPSGALLGSHAFTLPAHQLLVVNTSTLSFAVGASGTVKVSHNGRYGDLSGKAVAVEPATGFTFDTLMVPRER